MEIVNRNTNRLSNVIIGAAIDVHRELAAGLLERVYQQCLAYGLNEKGHSVNTEFYLPVKYKTLSFDSAYRLDLLVEDKIVVEVKAVESFQPVHKSQLLSYLKLSGFKLGLLINFNVPQLKQGIKRIVNDF